MSSKLRLNGKGTRGSAALSEKEQIDLAIALSLQQQGKEPQQRAEQLVPGGGDGQPVKQAGAAPAATNAVNVQLTHEPRKRRAAGHRKTYVLEESDSEGSQATSSGGPQGADDYKPEASGSGSDQDDDSDFAGDDESEDEGPRKKRKSEAPKGKKPPAKPPAGRKKAGPGDKAGLQAAAATQGTRALPSATRTSGAAGARGRKVDAAAASAASGLAPAAPVARHLVSKPTATARPSPATAAGRVPAVKPVQQEDSGHGSEDTIALTNTEAAPSDADIGELDRQQQPDGAGCVSDLPPCTHTDAVVTAKTVKATVAETVQPKAAEPKVKASAASKTAATKAPPLGKPATAKGPAQATPAAPKLPPKPLVLTNRTAPSAAMASAPFKLPTGTSGGASGIKATTPLPAGAMPYRVPGLRRPGGSSAAKKPS